jgi:hypothetical protein
MHLIVNQTFRASDISPVELGKMVGLPVDAFLPECRSEMLEASTSGKLLSVDSNFRRQIGRLAENVAGIDPTQAT